MFFRKNVFDTFMNVKQEYTYLYDENVNVFNLKLKPYFKRNPIKE